ncbi:Lipase 3 [Frankliniella fusca]|uniref:Lipase 3 n=1 Tax=Frankliniella fusca TaxID=407009 RepID=A0AAE1I3V6_9NEOP|nr:Lipase 3 [Frankliniella fusca]
MAAEMAAAVWRVLLTSAMLSTALAGDSADYSSGGPLWSAYVLGDVGSPRTRLDLSAWRRDFNPLLDLDPVDLSRYWGYEAEHHHVTTEDGYVLGIHRVKARAPGQRPVAILGHPLLSCSAEWTVLGPGRALAYLLADEGFDVWLFNVRGNTYSLNHTSLSTKSAAFWDFSFHEHGTLDLPAVVLYAMRATGERRVQYVGFSMGTTIMFVMAAERPDVARHVQLFTGLGPAAHLKHTRSPPFRLLLLTSPARMRNAAKRGEYWFLQSEPALRTAGEIFCSDGSPTQGLCLGLMSAIGGRNDKQNNGTLLPYIISRTPAGTSYKNIEHYAQSMEQGKASEVEYYSGNHSVFRQYDYGSIENLARYGQERPPKYDTKNVAVPTRLYYGWNDQLVDPRDVLSLCSELPALLSCEAVSDPLWTHLNFVWSKQAPELVYRKVIADMKEAANGGGSS